jgi:hypothetical protein
VPIALGVPVPGLAPPLGPDTALLPVDPASVGALTLPAAMSVVVPAVGPVTLTSDVLGEGMLAVLEEGRLGVPVISLSG